MNDLLQMKLFRQLSEPAQVTNEEIETAYGCFMKRIRDVRQSETDLLDIYRMLDNIRVELVFIELLYQYEQGKKCLEICLSSKSNSIS